MLLNDIDSLVTVAVHEPGSGSFFGESADGSGQTTTTKNVPDPLALHESGSGSFFGKSAYGYGQTTTPKNVPDPLVLQGK